MLKYEDLTEDEKHLSILIVNNEIILIGTQKECKDRLSKYLPVYIDDDSLYSCSRLETIQDLEEFAVYHAGTESCFLSMKDCNNKDFLYEIISSPWYIYESNYVDEQGCSEKDIYKAFEQRRLDLKANN